MIKIFNKLIFKKKEDKLKKLSVENVIKDFNCKTNLNLFFLIKKRFQWMQNYINKSDIGLEVGAGAGFSKIILQSNKIYTSDFCKKKHLDYKMLDAQFTDFKNGSFDFIIACNMLHHISYPVLFLKEMQRILKKNGRLIIFEPNLSFFYQIITLITKHEGFNFNVNIWDEKKPLNDPKDLWDSNQAISHLLFDNKNEFKKKMQNTFEIIYEDYCEFFLFINSGGVYSKCKYIPLNIFNLKLLSCIDDILIKICPKVFALGRKIVLKKK